MNEGLREFNKDSSIGAIVMTGTEKAFAAGADIGELSKQTFASAYETNLLDKWTSVIDRLDKPLIAAVTGYALGGGCELAMLADIIYASQNANFGQPEIRLGTIPGAGGTQRLIRAIGKSRAMEVILTGETFTAEQGERWGLVGRLFDTPEQCVEAACITGSRIASFSRVAVKACKDAVLQSQELALNQGLQYERRLFYGLFGTLDQKNGMKAFLDKTKPVWKNQ